MYWTAFILAFVITAAASDLWQRRIPRGLTLFGILTGLAFHAYAGGFLSSLLATILAFAAGLVLFRMGAIGGGDVKLITALGALLGMPRWLSAMEIAILVAGLIALAQVVRRGVFRQTLFNMGELARNFRQNGLAAHPEINVSNAAMIRAPFGISAAVGTLLAVGARL